MLIIVDYLGTLPAWQFAIIVIAVGWLAAGLARVLIIRMLRLFRFNHFCERIGLHDALRKGEVTFGACELVGRGIYWIILLGVFLEAAHLLDIGAAAELRQRAIAALPAILSAILVLAVGLIIVVFFASSIRTLSRNAGSPYANLWARLTRWAGTMLVLALAVEQSEIRGVVLTVVFYIVIAALGLGLALAFGLGCKDMARDAMEKWIAELKERHRDASKSDLEG